MAIQSHLKTPAKFTRLTKSCLLFLEAVLVTGVIHAIALPQTPDTHVQPSFAQTQPATVMALQIQGAEQPKH